MGFLQPFLDKVMSEREDDLEQQTIELHFQQAMNNVRKQNVRVQPTGFCLNCDEKLQPEQLFCDMDCREDYEKRIKAEAQRAY